MKSLYLSRYCIVLLFIAATLSAVAAPETIRTGSYIINMGITPQTVGNGLKPYGLVYSLLKNFKVPVKWVINGTKGRNGIDFVHNGVAYRGGTFIIPFEYRTASVNAEISNWEAQGVVGSTTVEDMVLDVIKTLHYAPNWTMDKTNGAIVENYFANAGIPSSAYGGDSTNWKNPDQLGACDDIFVMPHADPAWAVHNNLLAWNRDHKGNLWVACHAVSELENLTDPVSGTQLNFLTTGGMVPWKDHKFDATPPYQYADNGHPIMQFMDIMDNATINGSERTFLPKSGSAWRSTTTLGVYDTTNTHIPTLSTGPAAIVAYGHAFGDSSRGVVMYQGGHEHNASGTTAEQVAAQRAFFNFSFFVAVDRYVLLEATITGLPEVIVGNQQYDLSFTVPPGIDLGNYTIQWISSSGGTFSPNANSHEVTFTPPVGAEPCIVSVTITDGCGKEVFSSKGTFITGALPDRIKLEGRFDPTHQQAVLNWTATDNSQVEQFEVQRAAGNQSFQTIAMMPASKGVESASYSYTDGGCNAGACKYRLLVHKRSGSSNYTNTILIETNLNGKPNITLLGNPSRDVVTFTCESYPSGMLTATLFDLNGRIVTRKTLVVKGYRQLVALDAQHIPPGAYVLQVVTGMQAVVRKITVVK